MSNNELSGNNEEVNSPVFNTNLGMKVLGHLLSNPEQHDQSLWLSQNCKTTGCLAGWTAVLSGRTMIRRNPGDIDVDLASVLPGETYKAPYFVNHWTPKPDYLEARAEHEAALKAHKVALETYLTEYDDQVRAFREDTIKTCPRYAPPLRPRFDSPNETNHTSQLLEAMPISAAARRDLGVSSEMSSYLFSAYRSIGAITIVLGMLIGGQSEQEIFDTYIYPRTPTKWDLEKIVRENAKHYDENAKHYDKMNNLIARFGVDPAEVLRRYSNSNDDY